MACFFESAENLIPDFTRRDGILQIVDVICAEFSSKAGFNFREWLHLACAEADLFMIEMLVHAYVPALYVSLGIYLPLIVVNCIILERAESFASKNTVLRSALDGLAVGSGFTIGLLLISFFRD